MKPRLLQVVVVAMMCANMQAQSFSDDFNRPDSSSAGNGWLDSLDNSPGINLGIISNRLSAIPGTGDSGVFRPFPMTSPVALRAVITDQNGFGCLRLRYTVSFAVRSDGTLNGGYRVNFNRGDQNYPSGISLDDNGVNVTNISPSFQFGYTVTISYLVFNTDGSVQGRISGDGNTFDFSFPARTINSQGGNISIKLGGGDSRCGSPTPSTVDNFQVFHLDPAPTPPSVVQTNRAPTVSEVGNQTNGNFKVFTNGSFQIGIPLNTNRMTIVLTHGWNSSSDDWPANMASQLVAGGITANIVAWDWRDDAKQDRPSTALSKTPAQGTALGTNLLQRLGAGYNQPIHFIGHSFGTLVNAAAANYLHGEAPNNNPSQPLLPSRTQMTLLDEAEIAYLEGKLLKVNPATANLGWIKPLPKSFGWSDNYVSAVGELQDGSNVVNVILTENSPGIFYSSMTALWNALVVYHGVPYQWYGSTILNPAGSVMGNVWSFERTNSFTSPAGGTCFIQNGNGLTLNQISRYAADDIRVKQTAALAEQVAVYYTLKQVNALIHVAGDVTANTIETILTDSTPSYVTTPATIGISSYAAASPVYWSPQLILKTHSPVYAWLPLTIPTNATALSFDFLIQGDVTSGSFEAALNGTNVFSLALNLIQTNVAMNSGLIDVSTYAGTNAELFLGIVGDTSTNASVTVSGIRIYSITPPTLQAQASANNFVLQWPLSAQGYNLQTTTNLADTNAWATLPDAPTIVNLQNTVTNPMSGGAKFYRLKK